MKNIFDKGSVDLILRHGIEKGYWTLEQLDFPSPDYERNLIEARKSKYFGFDFFPPTPYVNPLRRSTTVEVVSADNTPDNLASAARANEGQSDVDIHPPQRPPLPSQRHRPDREGDQDRQTAGSVQSDASGLGATGQHPARNPGGIRQSTVEPQPTPRPKSPAPW